MSIANKPKFGYAHYVLFPNDGNRHELIDGDHYMNPAPSTYHQTVSKRLLFSLYSQIELTGLGNVFNAPIDVQLGPHDIVQPDLVVLLGDTRARITPSKVIGPPNLVVEILSPSTAETDLTLKRALYEREGVGEYWIVDPYEQLVTQLLLYDKKFVEQPTNSVELRLQALSELRIPLEKIW